MNVLDSNNSVWRKLVLGELDFNPSYLAASLLLWKLKLKLKESQTNDNVEKAKNEIFELYFKSKDFPNAKADLTILLSK